MKQITIRTLRPPAKKNLKKDIEWFCHSLGLLGERDKKKSSFRIFETIVKANRKNGISADELARAVGMSRTAVMHHVNTMIMAGLVVKEGGRFELRMKSLQKIVDEIELDINRTLRAVREVAKDIDKRMNFPVR